MIKKKKNSKMTCIIITPILITIGIYIRLNWFLKISMAKLIFNIDRKILKRLVIIKKISIKLIFSKYIDLA